MIEVEITSIPSCSLILPEDWCLIVFSFWGEKSKCRLYATWNIIQAYLDRMLILIVFLLYSGLV